MAQRLKEEPRNWTLRAFDLFYRIGGEGFLVLLPGADVERATAQPRADRPVTMSFGVSGSKSDEPFDYGAAFAAADARLYEAKGSGRNRVCPAPAELADAA